MIWQLPNECTKCFARRAVVFFSIWYLCSTSCKLLACNVTTEGCGFGSPCALSSYAAQVHGLSSMTIVFGVCFAKFSEFWQHLPSRNFVQRDGREDLILELLHEGYCSLL